jgi:hypothetical protein
MFRKLLLVPLSCEDLLAIRLAIFKGISPLSIPLLMISAIFIIFLMITNKHPTEDRKNTAPLRLFFK